MRRPALALLLGCLLLVAGVSALDGYDYYQTIEYAACDQEVYQQDIVIHRSTGTAYNETAGGLETWHIYVGEHCREDYGDVRFTNSTGELEYYLWPDYNSTIARFAVRLEGADAAGDAVVWYGNAAATTASDEGIFPFFDHYELDSTAAYTHVATRADGSPIFSVSSGKLTAGRGVRAYGMDSWYQDIQLEGKYQIQLNCTGMEHYGDSEKQRVGLTTSPAPTSSWEAFPTFEQSTWWSSAMGVGGATVVYPASISGTRYLTIFTYDRTPASSYILSLDYVLVRAYSATPPAATAFSGERETAAPPVTQFTATPTAGLAPLSVQFTDTSAGSPTSWLWDFGDGNTSTAQNPQHTYTAPRLYTVTLNATNEYGSDEEIRTDYITVYGPITAQFSATPTGGTAPVTVQFTDRSTGDPTSWLWVFGDGNTSTAQNPAHTYTTAGTHTVALTASHPYDSDTETKTSYITVAVLQPFPGLTLIPRDLAGNGLYTDINGNNRLDYNDLTVFFQHLAWAKTAQPIACFDFNGNGWLDYNDVIILFSTIMEEHT